jgi:hypothetical protein
LKVKTYLPQRLKTALDNEPPHLIASYLANRYRRDHIELLRLRLRITSPLPQIDLERLELVTSGNAIKNELDSNIDDIR